MPKTRSTKGVLSVELAATAGRLPDALDAACDFELGGPLLLSFAGSFLLPNGIVRSAKSNIVRPPKKKHHMTAAIIANKNRTNVTARPTHVESHDGGVDDGLGLFDGAFDN